MTASSLVVIKFASIYRLVKTITVKSIKVQRMICRMVIILLFFRATVLRAEIGATTARCISTYGSPERDEMGKSGLLYFRHDGLCRIAHFDRGRCDVLSIFSSNEMMGLPVDLDDEKITSLLKTEGGSQIWNPVARFSINKVWGSADNKSFAIYDTMRHKLAIMTREAYAREKSARRALLIAPKTP